MEKERKIERNLSADIPTVAFFHYNLLIPGQIRFSGSFMGVKKEPDRRGIVEGPAASPSFHFSSLCLHSLSALSLSLSFLTSNVLDFCSEFPSFHSIQHLLLILHCFYTRLRLKYSSSLCYPVVYVSL